MTTIRVRTHGCMYGVFLGVCICSIVSNYYTMCCGSLQRKCSLHMHTHTQIQTLYVRCDPCSLHQNCARKGMRRVCLSSQFLLCFRYRYSFGKIRYTHTITISCCKKRELFHICIFFHGLGKSPSTQSLCLQSQLSHPFDTI